MLSAEASGWAIIALGIALAVHWLLQVEITKVEHVSEVIKSGDAIEVIYSGMTFKRQNANRFNPEHATGSVVDTFQKIWLFDGKTGVPTFAFTNDSTSAYVKRYVVRKADAGHCDLLCVAQTGNRFSAIRIIASHNAKANIRYLGTVNVGAEAEFIIDNSGGVYQMNGRKITYDEPLKQMQGVPLNFKISDLNTSKLFRVVDGACISEYVDGASLWSFFEKGIFVETIRKPREYILIDSATVNGMRRNVWQIKGEYFIEEQGVNKLLPKPTAGHLWLPETEEWGLLPSITKGVQQSTISVTLFNYSGERTRELKLDLTKRESQPIVWPKEVTVK